MSDTNNPYGEQPQNPYGEQPTNPPPNPYGQPPAYGAGQPGDPYGTAAGYGYAPMQQAPYAHWGKRVLAYIVDTLITSVAMLPYYVGYGMWVASATINDAGQPISSPGSGALMAMFVGGVLGLVVTVWNVFIRQGRTGQTIGKGVMGIKLVGASTGEPIGALGSFVRQIAHIADSIPCGIGYLWPLWDAKRQTFADKIMGSVVVEAR